jgi:hypothetical protein
MSQILILAGAAIYGLLGVVHLTYTFSGTNFDPRDANVARAMRSSSPRLTRDTTMWKAWIGFNASHSLGAILFSLVYLMLAARHMDVLHRSPTFVWLAGIASAAYVVLALRYWFRIPLAATAIATSCFVAGAVTMSLGY